MNSLTPHCILLVEDEPLILFDAVDMVEEAGFRAYEARNADEALTILERNSDVDALFTDIDMPGTIDGLMLARTVKKRWPHIAIVVVSGHHRPVQGEIPSDGRFLPKPYGRPAIMRALRETIAEARK